MGGFLIVWTTLLFRVSYFSQPLSNASFVGPARVERRPKVYQSAVGIFGLAKATLLTNFTVDDARNWGNHPMVFICFYLCLLHLVSSSGFVSCSQKNTAQRCIPKGKQGCSLPFLVKWCLLDWRKRCEKKSWSLLCFTKKGWFLKQGNPPVVQHFTFILCIFSGYVWSGYMWAIVWGYRLLNIASLEH